MPGKGFITMTLSEEIYNKLKKQADKHFRTTQKEIAWMVDNYGK